MSPTPPPGYRTQSEDTTYEAELLLFERWRTMDLGEKAELIGQLSRATRELARAGLEQRLGPVSREEIDLRLLALLYGREVVKKVLGIDVPDESVRIGSSATS